MPDLWDNNPAHVFSTPSEQPDPDPNSDPKRPRRPRPPPQEVRLRDDRGQLRLPAYLLIALVIALVSILLVIAGLRFGPS
jgi:hypothetical protein